MMLGVRRKQTGKTGTLLIASLSMLGFLLTSCGPNVEVIRLTRQTFPPKDSSDAVEVLAAMPARPYQELADLRLTESEGNATKMQEKMLKKAAALGADAVVFLKPESHEEQRVAHYGSPWCCGYGAYGPGWGGPWGMGGYGAYGPGWGGPWGMGGYGGYGPGWGSPWGMGGYGAYGPGWGSYSQPYNVTVTTVKGTAIRYKQ